MLSTVQVCRVAGCSFRQLDYWVRVGAVRPEIPARGSGTHRMFSSRQALVVAALTQMAELGVPVRIMGEAASVLEERSDLVGILLVGRDGSVVSIDQPGDLPSGWISGWIIDLDAVLEDFGARVAA